MVKDFDFRHFRYPWEILKLKRFLDRSETWPRERLLAYQAERLRRIVGYAYKNVPYYRELFDDHKIKPRDIQTLADLQIVPPLTKTILRERFADLTSRECKKLNPVLKHTSGSTGTPVKVYLDRHINAARFAYFWRLWGWLGYRLGQRWATIRGSIFEDGAIFKYTRPINALYVSSFRLTRENSRIILRELFKFKPKMLRGFPAALYEFAKFVADDGRLADLKLNFIVADSEMLEDFQRAFLQKTFACPVYDCYSHWEHVNLISECGEQTRHHHMEYNVLEILDENDRPQKNGLVGEMTATGFYNLAMPLIRYKTRDRALRIDKTCACGRAHDAIGAIEGRHEDVVVTPEGRRIVLMSGALKFNKGFDMAQIVQNDVHTIDVHLVKNKHFSDHELDILEKHIRDRVGDGLKVNYVFVERIESDRSGKTRFVINNFLNKANV